MQNKQVVRLKKWCYEKGEKAKLIWIGEPFRIDKKWMVKVYFQSIIKRETKFLIVDWPTIHFLSVERVYVDGIINKSEVDKTSQVIDVSLSDIQPAYSERAWKIQNSNDTGISKTFNFVKAGKVYIIPLIEIIRGVLAIDRFTLNIMFNMQDMENYFIHEMTNKVLNIYFSNEYDVKLLTQNKVYNLAWILTNDGVLDMLNEISNSYAINGDQMLKFEFKLMEFDIKARVKVTGNKVLIKEVLELKRKKIHAREIHIEHPLIADIMPSGEAQKRKFITHTDKAAEEVQLNNDVDGAMKGIDLIESNSIIHKYDFEPEIIRSGLSKKYKRNIVDENTKLYFNKDKGERTLADVGGQNRVRGLEFTNVNSIKVRGELQGFVEIMKLVEKKPNVKKVDILIDNLPEVNGGRFALRENGITPRKFALAKIILNSSNVISSIIEIEKETKFLSMLILKSGTWRNYNEIYKDLLCGLVERNGTWDKERIFEVEKLGVEVIRKKHIVGSVEKICEKIYEKISY